MNNSVGKIITFYSYKGGVGRTMALANTAFLAACNGYKVLVMDWDLEAPGLLYYFRGLLDGTAARTLKDSPGVLDLLWQWNAGIEGIEDEEVLDGFLSEYFASSPFDQCVQSLSNVELLPMITKLDYIGSGSKKIVSAGGKSYEEALATFSWQEFFEEKAGGFLLEKLKEWARENYDYVFIDSRTGFADVSGICTMQLPDVVALCFILNRQNIDGVAKVSASIREQLKDQVKVRAAPMRVARIDTSEESDARARAITDLTRIGQFSHAEITDDIKNLQIVTEENMPFYETLAPLVTDDPALHPLSVSYMRMANSLLGLDLKSPSFSPEFIELARRRLMPKQATVEYLKKLSGFEPERALEELRNLIEGALETLYETGQVEAEYVKALVDTMDGVNDFLPSELSTLVRGRCLDLVRNLYATDHQKWRILLLQVLESMVDTFWMMGSPEYQLSLFDELDGVLSEVVTVVNTLKRIEYKRKAIPVIARSSAGDVEGVEQTLDEINDLIHFVESNYQSLASDQSEILLLSKADVDFLRGTFTLALPQQKLGVWLRGLNLLNSYEGMIGSDSKAMMFTLSLNVAELVDSQSREMFEPYMRLALSVWPESYAGISNFNRFARLLMKLDDPSRSEVAAEFLAVALTSQGDRQLIASAYGRGVAGMLGIIVSVGDVLLCLDQRDVDRSVVGGAADVLDMVARNFMRRRESLKADDVAKMRAPLLKAIYKLESLGVDVFSYQNLTRMRSLLE